MARGTSLVKLLDMYRAECRLSLSAAHNAQHRDAQVAHIQRTQEWLWDDFDWPNLVVERTINLAAGQFKYDMPVDMDIDRIQKIEIYYDRAYCPLNAGIDAGHYTAFNSLLDERTWPPRRWRIAEDEMVEVWPIPDTDYDPVTLAGTLKITGVRKLRSLVADTDTAELDDRMLILFCASEVLAASGAKDAGDKRNMANARYAKLRGHLTPRKKFSMFGASNDHRVIRVPIAVFKA